MEVEEMANASTSGTIAANRMSRHMCGISNVLIV